MSFKNRGNMHRNFREDKSIEDEYFELSKEEQSIPTEMQKIENQKPHTMPEYKEYVKPKREDKKENVYDFIKKEAANAKKLENQLEVKNSKSKLVQFFKGFFKKDK